MVFSHKLLSCFLASLSLTCPDRLLYTLRTGRLYEWRSHQLHKKVQTLLIFLLTQVFYINEKKQAME